MLLAGPLFGNIGAVLRATAQPLTPGKDLPVHVGVAMDARVSMRSSFQQAKAAVNYFYSKALAARKFASNTLYVFSGDTQKQRLDGLSAEQIRAHIYAAETQGGTNFNSVLSAIRKQVQGQPKGQRYFVVFFTDGQVILSPSLPEQRHSCVLPISKPKLAAARAAIAQHIDSWFRTVPLTQNRV